MNLSVNSARDCTWTATSEAAWLQLNATSGQGNATLSVSVASNEVPSPRSGAVVVNNQRVTISQEARPCSFTLSAAPQSLSSDPGAGTITIQTLAGCTWTAVSSAAWLRVLSASGSGPGSIPFEVAANPGGAREASVTIGGQSIAISQHAFQAGGGGGGGDPQCTFTLTPAVVNIPQAGGTQSVSLATTAACDWRATSNAPWLSVTPASGRGNLSLTLTATRNTGSARSATVTVGNDTVTVNQAAMPACTATIDSASANFASGGGDGRVRVTTPEGCEWTASVNGNASWVQITNGRGTGNGDARYTVLPNTVTSPRTATLTIGGRTHTVSQEAAAPTCTYRVEPTSQNFLAAGGTGQFSVITPAGCTWTARSNAGWVSATASGSSVSLTVQENTGAARQTTVTVEGQGGATATFTVNQEAMTPACTYSLVPPSQNFPHTGGSNSFTVNTQAGCSWTAQAASGQTWTSVTSTTATAVSFSVAANTATSTRSTTITVSGTGGSATFTVTQDAAPAPACTYSLVPPSQNFPHTGGSSSFTVNTQAGCSWTAQAAGGQTWASVTSTSATAVSFSVAANTATSTRSTTITVSGTGGSATFTVTQDAAPAPACTYSITATPTNFGPAGGGGTLTVTTQTGCAWTASAGQAWVTGGPWSGSGTQTASFSVQPNAGVARQTAITLNTGPSVGITQDPGTTMSSSNRTRQPF